MSSERKEVEISTEQFSALMKRAVNELGIPEEKIQGLKSVKDIKNEGKGWKRRNSKAIFATSMVFLLLVVPVVFYSSTQRKSKILSYFLNTIFQIFGTSLDLQNCLIPHSLYARVPFIPPVDCSLCVNVTGIHTVTNLSHAEFLEKYAFTTQPVVVKDGQNGWSAKEHFTFEFFKNIYQDSAEALEKVKENCQFFPYQTEFRDLGEMLNMSKDRIEGKGKPWYVGWSNCDGKVANILRKYYEFPYFLPPELDHSKIDWVFMGLPGYGADLHIDSVGADTLSWQAQIKGTKKWILEAPPECYGICIRRMEIIVEPGDIIVLDANKWFHETRILGNETSIVIGSEYY